MSFVPFLGGKRVCVGKTFAETTFKIIFPIILSALDFEFVDPRDREEKRQVNILLFKRPQVWLKAIRK